MKHPCNVTKARRRLSFYEFRVLFRDFCKRRTCFAFCWQKETVPSFQDRVDWGERRECDDYAGKYLNPNTTDYMFAVKLL